MIVLSIKIVFNYGLIKIIIVLFFIIPGYFFSQVKYSLDNTITGLYGTTKTGNQLTINLSGTNSIDYKKFGFDYNPTYSIQYSPEFLNRDASDSISNFQI